jgi:energy-coupling factor transport system substrate-specific component
MEKLYRWQLKDIIMVTILSLFFGVIYLGATNLRLVLDAALAPIGLQPFVLNILYGIWFMAATIAAYIMRKPGVAFVTEVMAAVIQVLMGNIFGPLVFVSGTIQGLASEAVFAAFKYKRYDMFTMCLAGFTPCITSFIWNMHTLGYARFPIGLLAAMFLVRTLSGVFFSGVLMKFCGDRLAKSGVLKAYPIGADVSVPAADK